jgi:mono/diheme cytochrome c family protein
MGMTRIPAGVAATLLGLAPAIAAAQGQGPVHPEVFAHGQALYEANCAVCHQTTGAGTTPVFPELRGNEVLADPYVLVSKVYQGLGNMPPFPTLSAADITAVASYVGNAWGNNFGEPTEEEVQEILSDFDAPQPVRTIWDGVFTKAQARRGQQISRAPCGLCHGRRMNGAPDDSDMVPGPALARATFLREWDGRSLGTLYTYSFSTMPQSNPGFLPPEDYAAIIAYMLDLSGAPAGDEELSADTWDLAHILIVPEP